MKVSEMKKVLREYKRNEIIFTKHSLIQMQHRQIKKEEVIKNILNPTNLTLVRERDAKKKQYDCFFSKSNRRGCQYGIVINKKCLIVTVIKIGKRWQKRVDNYAKKIQNKLR